MLALDMNGIRNFISSLDDNNNQWGIFSRHSFLVLELEGQGEGSRLNSAWVG